MTPRKKGRPDAPEKHRAARKKSPKKSLPKRRQKLNLNSSVDAALSYAAFGWPVFPVYPVVKRKCLCGRPDCKHPGKHPWTQHGFKDGTIKPARIRQLWESKENANVGICTGSETGILVVDIDARHGGHASLAKLVKAHGPIPKTVEAITGGGGRHYVFKHPGGKINTRANIRRGIDIRADGGSFVAPPSMHASGKRYRWKRGCSPWDVEPAELPDWLLKIIQEKKPSEIKTNGQATIGVVGVGSRNQFLLGQAGAMRRRGMSEAAILAALLVENQERCNPPLVQKEVEDIVRKAQESTIQPGRDFLRLLRLFRKTARN